MATKKVVATITPYLAIKEYFDVNVTEIKKLSKDDRAELSVECAKALGKTLEKSA